MWAVPDKAWKRLERKFAKWIGGERVKRMGDFSQPDTDVRVPGLERLRIDCKLRKRFHHHAIFREIQAKYVRDGRDRAVLVTKVNRNRLYLVSVEADLFVELLSCARILASDRPEKVPENLRKLLRPDLEGVD